MTDSIDERMHGMGDGFDLKFRPPKIPPITDYDDPRQIEAYNAAVEAHSAEIDRYNAEVRRYNLILGLPTPDDDEDGEQ